MDIKEERGMTKIDNIQPIYVKFMLRNNYAHIFVHFMVKMMAVHFSYEQLQLFKFMKPPFFNRKISNKDHLQPAEITSKYIATTYTLYWRSNLYKYNLSNSIYSFSYRAITHLLYL